MQGRPLQSPSHSMLTLKLGIFSLKGVRGSCQMGFQPSLMKVSPLSTVLPPATKGDQLPQGLLLSPQTQASSVERPGVLM